MTACLTRNTKMLGASRDHRADVRRVDCAVARAEPRQRCKILPKYNLFESEAGTAEVFRSLANGRR